MSQQFFIHSTNPEILKIVPRSGGIANIEPPKKRKRRLGGAKSNEEIKSQKSSTSTKSGHSRKSLLTVQTAADQGGEEVTLDVPRRVKVREAIQANPWVVEFDDEDVGENTKIIPEVFQDAVDLLICTISTIMLMSKGYKSIPENFLQWTFSYLKCIKDDFDHNPPNIQGIINHILELSGDKMKSFLDEDDAEAPAQESKVRISTAAPSVAPLPDEVEG